MQGFHRVQQCLGGPGHRHWDRFGRGTGMQRGICYMSSLPVGVGGGGCFVFSVFGGGVWLPHEIGRAHV